MNMSTTIIIAYELFIVLILRKGGIPSLYNILHLGCRVSICHQLRFSSDLQPKIYNTFRGQ